MDEIKNLSEILDNFTFEGNFKGINVIKSGHINNTFAATFDCNGTEKTYLIQQINTFVFKKPAELMENFAGVTDFLRKKIAAAGGDPERECLRVYKTKDGSDYYTDKDGGCWRCLNFIADAHSEECVSNPELFRKAAVAFGNFQRMLADYPIETLHDTIPNFHNTLSRFSDFKKACADNLSGRYDTAKAEAEFALAREKDCGVLVGMIDRGELPLRVTHNDTKLNNVMLDNKTGEGICVVDLDTVMPGLSLYDFGDSIRFGANTAAEDEKDLSKVSFSLENFKAFTDGFISACGTALTKNEIHYLPFSSKLMTLECGMRFLGDYFNGDVYFKTEYPEHNLVRCRTQFKLVAEMEKYMEQMEQIVADCCKKYGIEY